MTIRNPRTELVGVHLRPRVKEALREEAERRKEAQQEAQVSMSATASEMIEEALTTRGYNLAENPQDRSTPLLDTIEETKPCAE